MHTDEEGENVWKYALVMKRVTVFCAGKLLQEVTAHELLGDRRAPLIEGREMRDQGSNVCLGQQTKEDGIVHSGM